jgi:hypothetical protein
MLSDHLVNRTFEYELPAKNCESGKTFRLKNFPELECQYLFAENSLCESYYHCDVKCVSKGTLSIALLVNGEVIKICDEDQRKQKVEVVHVRDCKYIFQGTGFIVNNKSRNDTSLVFTITKLHKEPKVIEEIIVLK